MGPAQAMVTHPAYEGVGFQKVTVTDAEDNDTVFISNLAGQRTFMSDPNSGASTYVYDDNGQTVSVSSATGDIFMAYDVLGRMELRRTFPVGVADGFTEGEWLTSALWQSESVWDYIDDALDGPVGALETTSSTSKVEVGTTREFTTLSTVDTFDVFGRPLSTTVTLPESPSGTTLLGDLSGYAYTTSVSYDPDTGVVEGSTLPEIGGLPEEVVSTGYRLNGMAETLTVHAPIVAPAVEPDWSTTVVSGTSVDGTGQFLSRTYGNGVTRSIGWDTVTRAPEVIAASFEVGETTELLQQDVLTRDVAGRVTVIDDQVMSSAQCYTYDGHNRLQAAWTTDSACGTAPVAPSTSWLVGDPASASYAASYATSWEYSDSGKIESIVNFVVSGDPLEGSVIENQYSYAGIQPHAVSATSDGVSSTSYTYDGAGRMDTRTVDDGTGDVATTCTWDVSSNLVATVEDNGGPSFLYLYDGTGQRLLKVRLDDPLTTGEYEGTATAYVGSTEVTDADTSVNADLVLNPNDLEDATFVTGTRYYTFGGATVAVRKGNAAFDDSLSLLVGDFQGSASILVPVHVDATTKAMLPATLADAQNATRNAYLPYGATRGTDNLTTIDHGWLNQVTDESDTGLIYLNARYYDPILSRFISPDPLMNPGDPRTLDPYRYADNNPILFQDVSGLNPGCAPTDTRCWADYANSGAYGGAPSAQQSSSPSTPNPGHFPTSLPPVMEKWVPAIVNILREGIYGNPEFNLAPYYTILGGLDLPPDSKLQLANWFGDSVGLPSLNNSICYNPWCEQARDAFNQALLSRWGWYYYQPAGFGIGIYDSARADDALAMGPSNPRYGLDVEHLYRNEHGETVFGNYVLRELIDHDLLETIAVPWEGTKNPYSGPFGLFFNPTPSMKNATGLNQLKASVPSGQAVQRTISNAMTANDLMGMFFPSSGNGQSGPGVCAGGCVSGWTPIDGPRMAPGMEAFAISQYQCG